MLCRKMALPMLQVVWPVLSLVSMDNETHCPGHYWFWDPKKNNYETKLLPAQTAHSNKIQNPLISHHVMTHALKCTDKHALLFVCAMLAFRTPSCTASEVKFSLPRYSFQILQNWNTWHESYKLTPGGSTSHRLKVRQPIRYVLLPWQAMANYWHPTPANLVICKCSVT